MTANELLETIRALAELHPDLAISDRFNQLDKIMQDPYVKRPDSWEDWSDKK